MRARRWFQLVVPIVVAVIAPVLARKKPRPQPCPEARYLVSGEPLIAGDAVAVHTGP